ncbi:hypothetical protein CEQ12_05125 [Staphylococcus cohnii]|nr:hypothetical protein CEQ12_05125 [Staphylococcus cohnii]
MAETINEALKKAKIKKVEDAIEAATQVQKQAKIKLGEVTQDQLVTPDEKAEIDKMNVEIEKAKSSAIQVLDALPNGLTNKDLLRKRINDITSVTSPEVNDADSNGVLDTEQLSEATQAAVDTKLAEVTADGLVTPDEKAAVDALIQTLESAKQTAKEKLNNVSNIIVGKDDLQIRLDNIASVTSPEVNDVDSNGVLDTDQLSEASQAVANAEQAKTVVDNKLTEVTADGLVTPDEKSAVDALVQTLEATKQTAQEKVNSVPSSTEGKADLQTRLNSISSVTSPEVNDAYSNGMLDTDQLTEASQAVVNAEQTKTAVDNKLAEVTSDGLVMPDEKSAVDTLVQTLEAAKQTAQEKINNVPSGTAGKDDLQRRLDSIASVTSPEVNDADSNGVQDTKQVSEVSKAIKATESTKAAVDKKLAEIQSDGLVNPKEKAAIDQLIQKLDKEKQAAKAKLAKVPNGTAGKAELQRKLNEIPSVTSPRVNDEDSNGVQDTKQVSEAKKAIADAKAAQTKVINKIKEIRKDGLITPSEQADLDKLIEKLDSLRSIAKEKISNLPNGTSNIAELQTNLDKVTSEMLSKVKDIESNGISDKKQSLGMDKINDKYNSSHFENDEKATKNNKSLDMHSRQFNVQNNHHNLERLNKKLFVNPNKENNFNMNLPYSGLDKNNPYAFEILFGILGLMIVYRRYLKSDKNTEH